MNKIQRLTAFLNFLTWHLSLKGALKTGARNYVQGGHIVVHAGGRLNIGELNVLSRNYDIEVKGLLQVGSRNYMNKNVKIVCLEEIVIGDDCVIADSVHIYDHDHQYGSLLKLIKEQGYKTSPVKIGNNVWIGAKATILKGVTIGDGAIIGANALVTKAIPANAIAAGNPAQIVKMRSDDR